MQTILLLDDDETIGDLAQEVLTRAGYRNLAGSPVIVGSADTPDCTKRSLRQHISNLRRKLASHIGRDCIEAVWGIGFRLKL